MAAAVEEHTGQSGADFRSSRTKAMPKHTLFGSSLERLGDEEMEEVRKLDMEAYEAEEERRRQTNRRTRRQDADTKKIQGEPVLIQTREEVAAQQSRRDHAKDKLQTAEEQARYFTHTPGRPQKVSPAKSTDVRHKLHGIQADMINDIGFKGSKAYNREKFQQLPPVHQYSLIGDVMRFGMDFNSSYKEDYGDPHHMKGLFKRDKLGKPKYGRRSQEPESVRESPRSAIYLPPNIKHQFGTHICDSVLSDPDKVKSAMDTQKSRKEIFMRKRTEVPVSAVPPEKGNPEYDSLSNALRQNVFPGYSVKNKSFAKSVYTMDVHENRVPDPDQFRYQRDQLSTWAEQNVLRERVKKAWDVYLAETMQKVQT